MNNLKKIRISRSKFVEEDRSIAIIRLNNFQHLAGQPVMVRYYTDSSHLDVDTIFALGIKDGIGEKCYKILNIGGQNIIRGIANELPDVSALVHGEIYLWKNSDSGRWCFIYLAGSERIIEEIEDGPYVFTNIEDKLQYYYDSSDGILIKEFDYLPKSIAISEINKLKEDLSIFTTDFDNTIAEVENHKKWLMELDKEIFPLKTEVISLNGNLFLTGTIQNIKLQIRSEHKGKLVSRDCSYYLNGEPIETNIKDEYTVYTLSESKKFNIRSIYSPMEGMSLDNITDIEIKFGYYFYYGVISSNWTESESSVKGLSNIKLQTKEPITLHSDLLNQRIVFACPTEYGKLSHILDDNQFDYINDYDISTMNIDNHSYYIYTKKHGVTIENFKQTFIY